MNRLAQLSARIDEHLRQFAAIDTAQEPWSYSGCCDSDMPKKPNFPSLYISRSKDAGLMKMQGEGKAVVSYRVTSRNVDESKDDGIPLYGANIEVRSIEAIPGSDEEGGEEDLSSTIFLRHFAVARDRDGEGRFASGNIPSPDDYAIANQSVPKKKMGLGTKVGIGVAGVAAGAIGGGLVRARKSSALAGSLRDSLLRGAGRAR